MPGVATGLAVTGAGGDVLYIEANAAEGERSLTLTGQLGDVMKESAQIALTYVRSHLAEIGIEPSVLDPAQRAGLKTVFIPARNEPDLDEVPAEVLAALDVRPVADVADILAYAIEPVAEPAADGRPLAATA
ncbi:ATP-dependent protease La [Mycobacteroides abscessus subsp. abscessus]|nr:ATP-dependent protease La [Mycobacteroides abscessus subsp. abscessus]